MDSAGRSFALDQLSVLGSDVCTVSTCQARQQAWRDDTRETNVTCRGGWGSGGRGRGRSVFQNKTFPSLSPTCETPDWCPLM